MGKVFAVFGLCCFALLALVTVLIVQLRAAPSYRAPELLPSNVVHAPPLVASDSHVPTHNAPTSPASNIGETRRASLTPPDLRYDAPALFSRTLQRSQDKIRLPLTIAYRSISGGIERSLLERVLKNDAGADIVVSIEPIATDLPSSTANPATTFVGASQRMSRNAFLAGAQPMLSFPQPTHPVLVGLFVCSDPQHTNICSTKEPISADKPEEALRYQRSGRLFYFSFLVLTPDTLHVISAETNLNVFLRGIGAHLDQALPDNDEKRLRERVRSWENALQPLALDTSAPVMRIEFATGA
ncbi:MAG: hypothetical protein U0136_07750 [Bdellovibrionota bacterium]